MPLFSSGIPPFMGHHNSASKGQDLLKEAREILNDRLYFTPLPYHPPQFPDVHFFCIDHVLIYVNFYADFGPNNLAQVFRFCEILQEKLKVRRSIFIHH